MRKYSMSMLLSMIAVCVVLSPRCQAQSISGTLGLQPGILAVDLPVTTSANSIANEMTADPAAMPAIPSSSSGSWPGVGVGVQVGFLGVGGEVAVAIARHYHRLTAKLGGEIVPRFRHLASMTDEKPGTAEHALHLEIEDLRVGVNTTVHAPGLDQL